MMKNNTKKYKCAVVGLGHIGKRHVEEILEHPDLELIAYCDLKTLDECKQVSLDGIDFYHSYQKMLEENKEIDVLSVCVPNYLHAEVSISALNAGAHVICEKPMALHKEDCEKMIHASVQNQKDIFVVMQNRFSPTSVWLKKIVDSGVLGKIYKIQCNCFWNRDQRYYTPSSWHGSLKKDGGPLYTQFSHFLDIIYWLWGDFKDPRPVFYNHNHKHNTEFEDSGEILFSLGEQTAAHLSYSTSVFESNLESSLSIIAEKGTIKVAGQYMNEVVYCNIDKYQMEQLPPTLPPNDYGGYKGSARNHKMIFDNVVDRLSNGGEIATNLMDGMKVVEIIERIYHYRK